MGFMDKAKKMAEQAQAKLDEAQKQFQGSGDDRPQGAGPAVEYDQHGRPIPSEPPATATPPHGDPVGAPDASAPPPTPPQAPAPDPAAPVPPPAPPAAPAEPPAATTPPPAPPAPPSAAPEGEEDPNRPGYKPPKLSSGDPLG